MRTFINYIIIWSQGTYILQVTHLSLQVCCRPKKIPLKEAKFRWKMHNVLKRMDKSVFRCIFFWVMVDFVHNFQVNQPKNNQHFYFLYERYAMRRNDWKIKFLIFVNFELWMILIFCPSKVAKFTWKMRNVMKWIKNQYSDF